MTVWNVTFILSVLCLVTVDRGCGATGDDITSEVFQTDVFDMLPVAVGDFDSDRVMDTVFLSRNLSFFQIYFGHSNPPFLRPREGFSCETDGKIIGLASADFTGDGILDILITFQGEDFKSVQILKGSPRRLDCRKAVLRLHGNETFLRLKQEPLIVDVNGDMVADLVGELSGESGRKLWLFKGGRAKMVSMQCGAYPCLPLSVPHISAFADLDGDFSPELLTISHNETTDSPSHLMEVLSIVDVQNDEPKFEASKGYPFGDINPKRIGNFLLLDLEQDGKITPMLPFCADSDCQISGFMIQDGDSFRTLNVNFTDEAGHKWGFVVPESTPHEQTINLRVGDVDLDGYPDLIGTLRPIGGSENKSVAVIFFNAPCPSGIGRTFRLKFDLLAKHDDAISAIFFDFHDNGLLDVMMVRRVASSGSCKVQVFLNSPKYDGYFLKLMMTSMHCQEYCPPYGAVLPGASMNYTMVNQHSQTQSSKAAQFYRSAHFPADLPFVVIGTGSTPNFIDTVWIGKSPSRHIVSVQKWRQIIPNSHLVVIPHKGRWELRHFLSTNEEGAWSTLKALLLIIFINGVIVFLLWLKERKEDRKNVQMRGTVNFVRLT